MAKNKKIKSVTMKKQEYSSAEFLQQPCFEDYKRLIDSYDKIYEKVNITLAFSGIILLVILGSVDYTYIIDICKIESKLELCSLLIVLLCSFASAVSIVWSVVQLLLLMRSKVLPVFNSIDIRNEGIYNWNVDKSALWLIDKYTKCVAGLRDVVSEKQKKYDSAVTKIVISLILYAIVLIVEKGV